MSKMYRLYRGDDCHGLRTCGLCAQTIPALAEDGGLLISAPNLTRHEQEIEDVVLTCPAGAICLDEIE